jgi:hypothetical protein
MERGVLTILAVHFFQIITPLLSHSFFAFLHSFTVLLLQILSGIDHPESQVIPSILRYIHSNFISFNHTVYCTVRKAFNSLHFYNHSYFLAFTIHFPPSLSILIFIHSKRIADYQITLHSAIHHTFFQQLISPSFAFYFSFIFCNNS